MDNPKKADFLVTGFVTDLKENAEDVQNLLKENQKLQVLVFSEEPLWDTLWSGNFQRDINSIEMTKQDEKISFNYHVLNHVTSNIYEFKKIPYFITTSDDFFVRYNNLFRRNAKLSIKELEETWRNAEMRYSFFAAKRINESSSVSYKNGTILGLNRFRSLVAEGLSLDGVLREGQGWQVKEQRQALPDWHLDKLAKLDRNAYVVSALENTHLNSYISEKIFDAYAVLGIPLYYAQKDHYMHKLVQNESLINLSSLSIEDAILKIENFSVTKEFIESYRDSQKMLSELFANQKNYIDERKYVVEKTIEAFQKLN
ncbi:hypothetical protein [Sulfurimonas sp.]|uniref:hypothetical protein n=1 Tax=Sulfurimonas sp. TaxID=2022749 RepID=UPI003D0F8C8D